MMENLPNVANLENFQMSEMREWRINLTISYLDLIYSYLSI